MKTTRILNVKFTVEEMQQIGIDLALANQERERLDDRKKQTMSQFKCEIDAVDASIKTLAQKLARGSEDRVVECEVLYHTPEEGAKTILRTDTGEKVEILKMTDSELQDLFINNLGAQCSADEFVFRDKTRIPMITAERFADGEDKFVVVVAGMSEKELVDNKPGDTDCMIAVRRRDDDDESYDLCKFIGTAETMPELNAMEDRA